MYAQCTEEKIIVFLHSGIFRLIHRQKREREGKHDGNLVQRKVVAKLTQTLVTIMYMYEYM